MLKNVVSDYNPLLGAWLIDMALMLNWYKLTRRNGWAEIFLVLTDFVVRFSTLAGTQQRACSGASWNGIGIHSALQKVKHVRLHSKLL